VIRKQLKRRELVGQARYLTFSCMNRLPLLRNDAIKALVVKQLEWSRQRLGYDLLAWVLMPEHVHMIVLPDPPRVSVSSILADLKRPVAQRVLRRWRQLNAGILQRIVDADGRAHFWQAGGGYDRNLCIDGELWEKIIYVHENPCRRGLVERATDWPWSSAREYVGSGGGKPMIARHLFA